MMFLYFCSKDRLWVHAVMGPRILISAFLVRCLGTTKEKRNAMLTFYDVLHFIHKQLRMIRTGDVSLYGN